MHREDVENMNFPYKNTYHDYVNFDLKTCNLFINQSLIDFYNFDCDRCLNILTSCSHCTVVAEKCYCPLVVPLWGQTPPPPVYKYQSLCPRSHAYQVWLQFEILTFGQFVKNIKC